MKLFNDCFDHFVHYKLFKDWTLFEKCWLSTFTLINIYLFFAWGDTLVGLATSMSGMICVVLVAKGKIGNYFFGVINVLLYSWVSYNNKFFGEVSLNMLYFLPMQFIGMRYWVKNKDVCKGSGIVSIKTLTPQERAVWPVVVILAVLAYWQILGVMGGNLPFADSTSTVLSVFAMILMVKRVVESWLLWILVDLISIYMWFYTLIQGGNDISMLVMWSAYLVNAIYGYYNWNKMVTVND